MKKKIALVLFCFIILDFFSQEVEAIESNYNETQQEDQIYTIVDVNPEYPGGSKEMFAYIAKNMNYPTSAIENEKEGKVFIRFVIDKSGNIVNPEIARGIGGCPECEQEALRIIRAMPKWKPAMVAGEPVKSLFYLPITFHLE
jgi:protein TonB